MNFSPRALRPSFSDSATTLNLVPPFVAFDTPLQVGTGHSLERFPRAPVYDDENDSRAHNLSEFYVPSTVTAEHCK